ncbi:MAG: arylesterase, partial [Pararhizobium sp.]
KDNRPPAQSRSVEESQKFAPLYAALATEFGTGYFDAGTVVEASVEDGVHLSAENTRKLGTALAKPVRDLLAI